MGILGAFMLPHPPLIVPEIGKGEEKKIQKTVDAYHTAARKIAELKPETIVVFSPHSIMYADYFHISPGSHAQGDFSQFRAGQIKMDISYDMKFVQELCQRAKNRGLPAGTAGEQKPRLDHGTMVPLYFVNQYWTDYQLVRIGLSGLPFETHYQLGRCVKDTIKTLGRNAVLIASGDLSHRLKENGPYGYKKEGPEYDACIMEIMGQADFGALFKFSEHFCAEAGECGHRSFTIMAGALEGLNVQAQRLSYEGPFGVGYGICIYEIEQGRERSCMMERAESEDAYVWLARKSMEAYIRTGKKMDVPEGLPQEMYQNRAGVFVSIKKEGALRGCIGTIQAVYPSIAEEIIFNAISASTRDPRFPAVEAGELEWLTVSVDVLGDMERIDSPDKLDVKRYGVVVTKDRRRGLLLPNLEGVNTVEEQVAIAKQKAGIGYLEEVQLERFEVVRHL